MMKKQGITITMLVVTIILMIIIAGTISFSMYSTIEYSRMSAWANEIMYIQDVVDENLNSTSATEFTSGVISMSVDRINAAQNQFEGENINESNTLELRILELGKLKITTTNYGNLETETDVYALSETTGKVYYVRGIEADEEIYYTLTESLRNRYELTPTQNELASVVFVPNTISYTNNPVQVTVKLPNTYTNITIITSNNEIVIGAQQVQESTYEYLVNGNGIAGNYIITVSYNNGTEQLTSTYQVKSYDVEKPVIDEIKYENIVYKETDTQKVEYLTNITATDNSGIKVIKYALGEIAEENAKEYFSQNGTTVSNDRINLNREATVYTVYVEDKAGNFAITTFDKKYLVPESWKASIWYIQDRVPIPKGFVASEATGENTKNGGLVIYEGTTPVTDANVEEAKRERNQYVWVPVSNSTFETQFVRRFHTDISNELGTNLWEIVLDKNTNMPLDEQDEQYVSATTLKEAKAMYSSVKKYGGFYVARYEAGIDKARTRSDVNLEEKIYSMMGKIPYTYVIWGESMDNEKGGSVEASRNIYPADSTNYRVVSTLIYGVQWDTTLQWMLDTKALPSIDESINYGNYKASVIKSGDLNEGARYALYSDEGIQEYKDATGLTKESSTMWSLSTGALKYAKINNIYDMAGNIYERTMEGAYTNAHCFRGASWYGTYPISARAQWATIDIIGPDYGFRVALYIK